MKKVLSDMFHVKGRFRRSVHLERDFYTDENLLEGYVVTVTALEMLERIVSALENGESSKAWSLTGPYGSGKSAFALFTANLLGSSASPITQQALKLLEQRNIALHKRLTDIKVNEQVSSFEFCPILISGERSPISIALLRGLQQGLISFNGRSQTKSPLPTIQNKLKAAEAGILPNPSEIIKLFKSAMHQIEDHGGTGLLLVIDEFGKFLEYASQYPAQGDIHVLQELAEFADRSEKTPLFLLTILHQAFEMYGQRTAKLQREEWEKIQGRFEDVPFTEPTEHLLRLVGTAIKKSSEIVCKDDFNTVTELGIKLHQLDNSEFIQLLESCLPLHPTVALLIGTLSRRFSQNERSLFAFLNSSEPYGLQDFLSNQHYEDGQLPMYRLADLYDYFHITQGNKLYTSGEGKKWAEIESAINRLPDPSEITVKLIKTIGLLGIAGEAINSLKASKKLLYYALDNNSKTFTKDFDVAITKLKKHSIIIYRRYNDTFSIWEGSDIDIETKLREAETHVNTTVAVATNLSHYMPTRPLVARRHLFDKGTLRYFTVRYTNLENFDVNLIKPPDKPDGLLLYALPASEYEAEQLRKKAKQVNEKEVLIAIPNSIGSLQEAAFEVAKLRWVQQNTPELQRNNVASRELSARLIEAEADVSRQLKAIFDEAHENTCRWYHKGQEKTKTISTYSARNAYLSQICDKVYNKTPILRNELINRRKISGTVTAARRELIQAMLENGDQEDLGITGYPPEMSIYRSLLLNSGIHRSKYRRWGFHPPNKKDDKNRMKHTWSAIEDFLTKCENKRQPIEELYKCLTEKPYGIRRGPLPILLCAAMLCYKTEVALYENDSFVADLSMPVFERLLKVPKKFELKRFRMTGHRTGILAQYLDALNQILDTDTPSLLSVTTPLMLFVARLPKYTLMTQTLSENAKNLREVVLDAREPDTLLFHDLPEVMGYTPFSTETDTNPKTDQFFKAFQNALDELKQTYPSLRNFVAQQLASNFSVEYKGKKLCRELMNRAKPLEEVTSDTQLTGFLMRICDSGLDFDSWLEAIATFVVNKPPVSWMDADKTQFEINLSQLARKFQNFEVVSYEKRKHSESSESEPIRVGITRPNQPEQEWVVTLPFTAEKEVPKIGKALKQALDHLEIEADPDLRSAILARISQEWKQQQEK